MIIFKEEWRNMKKQDEPIFGTNAGLFDPFPSKKDEDKTEDKEKAVHGLGIDAGLFETGEKKPE